MDQSKEATANLKSCEGKTIHSTEVKADWRDEYSERITIIFSDGSQLQLCGMTMSGCSECDPEGMDSTWIDTMFKEKK